MLGTILVIKLKKYTPPTNTKQNNPSPLYTTSSPFSSHFPKAKEYTYGNFSMRFI